MYSVEVMNGKGWTVCVSEFCRCHLFGVLRCSCPNNSFLGFVGRLRAVTAERTCGHQAIRVQDRWEKLFIIEPREILCDHL
jgi:hypothetical protein